MKTEKKVYSRIRLLIMLCVVMTGLLTTVSVLAETVAKIGSSSYSSVAKALFAANNGQTVKLIKNATYSFKFNDRYPLIGKKVTIDLNQKKLTIKGSLCMFRNANVTIKNGEIGYKKNAYMLIDEKSTVKMQNCKFNMKIGNSIRVDGKSKLTLNKCTVSITDTGISSEEKSELIINGGTYVFRGTGRLGTSGGKLTIKKGNFYNRGRNVIIAANPQGKLNGTVTIKGGSFTGLGGVLYLGKKQNCTITGGKFSSSQDSVLQIYGNLNVKGGTISGGHPSDEVWPSHGILCFETARVKLYKGATVKGGNNTAIGYSYYKGAVVKNYGAVLVDGK